MSPAAGKWTYPPLTPDDPRSLCLVLLEDRQRERTYQIMRYVRRQWLFPGKACLSNNQRVICWATINDAVVAPVSQQQEN